MSPRMRYVPVGDGSHWPSVDDAAAEFQWQALHGTPNPVVLAGYMAAYFALVNASKAKREIVVRGLRLAAKRLNASDAKEKP